MSVLLDTSFLLAVASNRDAHHLVARIAMRELKQERVVVEPALTEIFYMLRSRVNYASAMRMFKLLRSVAFHIEPLTDGDMARMDQIMAQYEDNAFDFVDTAIMAVSERLDITDVYTLDRRDFGVFR